MAAFASGERTSFRFLAVNDGQMSAIWSLAGLAGWPKPMTKEGQFPDFLVRRAA